MKIKLCIWNTATFLLPKNHCLILGLCQPKLLSPQPLESSVIGVIQGYGLFACQTVCYYKLSQEYMRVNVYKVLQETVIKDVKTALIEHFLGPTSHSGLMDMRLSCSVGGLFPSDELSSLIRLLPAVYCEGCSITTIIRTLSQHLTISLQTYRERGLSPWSHRAQRC